jgi:mannose-6-phosphate isomerase-like protein (cupin superfamily)
LVDARNSVSSHLHCIEITLKPGTGLVPRISSCVEYYYVLRGEGMYRYGCNEDDAEMQETIMNTGNHIIVQPWQ